MQFQVPQFIETEDKIVGPLTVRQFIYVAGALGVSAILFFTTPTLVWIVASFFVVGLAAALAFVKINGQPFIKILLSGFNFYWRPQTYVWQEVGQAHSRASFADGEHGQKFSINNIISGLALKTAWRSIQTGTAPKKSQPTPARQERYQMYSHLTGERTAAKRIDYR